MKCLDCDAVDVVGLDRCAEHFLTEYDRLLSSSNYIFKNEPEQKCLVLSCQRIAPTRLLCHKHYQRYRAGTLLKALSPRELRHGTYSTYANEKCRCELCTIANNAYHAGLRAKRKESISSNRNLKHGTANVYLNHSCRCVECMAWSSSYNKEIYISRGDKDYWLFQRSGRKGACDLCGKITNTLNWDHNHADGAFRGYLCVSCNTGIGKLGDSIEGLERALAYLKSEPIYY